ncbi:MAG: type IV secretory system conjugative DNA transfer family protein [Ancrocorticia sp.]
MKAKRIFLAILAIVGVWAGNRISWQVRTDHEAGLDLSQILERALNALTNNPFSFSFDKTDLLASLGVLLVGGFIALYMTIGKGTRRPGEEYGSARWGKPSDIKPFTSKKTNENLLFTKTERLGLDGRATHRNLNVLVLGGSGSGKSRRYVLPNLAQTNQSFIITDPKGELRSMAGDILKDAGYKIRCLDLVDFDKSNHFNPLRYIHSEQPEVGLSVLVENIMTNTSSAKQQTSGDFWEKAERALLTALTSYVYFTQGASGTLLDVVDLLAKMEASEEDETQLSEVDQLFTAAVSLIAEYDADPDGWGAEAIASIEGLRFASAAYRTYTQGAGETKKSVIISLGVRLTPLTMSNMRRLLSQDTMDLDMVGQEKTALFLVLPDTHGAFNFLASIFYEQLFETNLYLADHRDDRFLPVPIHALMDEFANIGKIPGFVQKIAVMRSRGISVSVILQNRAQGKAQYKDEWESIEGNCDNILFLGGQEPSTTAWLAKLLGKQTIQNQNTSETRGKNGSWSKQNQTLGRELLTPDEIGKLDDELAIYLLRGVPPFLSRKLDTPTTGHFTYDPDAEINEILDGLDITWEPLPDNADLVAI